MSGWDGGRGGMGAGVGWGRGWDGGRGLPVMDSHSIQMKKQYSDSASLLYARNTHCSSSQLS